MPSKQHGQDETVKWNIISATIFSLESRSHM